MIKKEDSTINYQGLESCPEWGPFMVRGKMGSGVGVAFC